MRPRRRLPAAPAPGPHHHGGSRRPGTALRGAARSSQRTPRSPRSAPGSLDPLPAPWQTWRTLTKAASDPGSHRESPGGGGGGRRRKGGGRREEAVAVLRAQPEAVLRGAEEEWRVGGCCVCPCFSLAGGSALQRVGSRLASRPEGAGSAEAAAGRRPAQSVSQSVSQSPCPSAALLHREGLQRVLQVPDLTFKGVLFRF